MTTQVLPRSACARRIFLDDTVRDGNNGIVSQINASPVTALSAALPAGTSAAVAAAVVGNGTVRN